MGCISFNNSFFGITGELKLSVVGVLAVFALGALLIYKSYILFLDGKNENAKINVDKCDLPNIYSTYFLFDKIF